MSDALEELAPSAIGETRQSNWSRAEQIELLETVLRPLMGAGAHEMAGDLVARFGSLPATLAARHHQLLQINGVDEMVVDQLMATMEVAQRLAREDIYSEQPLLDHRQSIVGYCRTHLAYLPIEHMRILFLDKKSRLIADEVHQVGTIDYVPVYPREVIRRAIELSATGLVLAHNHPSGHPAPSNSDVAMSHRVKKIGRELGIHLHDHIIIGKYGYVSMEALGMLTIAPAFLDEPAPIAARVQRQRKVVPDKGTST
jgi:DNA repair protein RadC